MSNYSVSDTKIDGLLSSLIESIRQSIADGKKLPWQEPYFVGYLNSFVNALNKKEFDGTECPEGRPYKGFVNSLFLAFGAEAARKRNENAKLDHRFVARSAIISKNPKWKCHKDATCVKGTSMIFVFRPNKKKIVNRNFDSDFPESDVNPKHIWITLGWAGGHVINVADTNLVELGVLPELDPTTERDNPDIEVLNSVIGSYPQDYAEEECIPHYDLSAKHIRTPALRHAKSSVAHWGTRCHELAHQLQDMHGTASSAMRRTDYSINELEAEFTRCYVLGQLGFMSESDDEFTNSATYIQGWLSKLASNPRWLFDAAVNATKYGNLILKGKLPYKIESRSAFHFLPKEDAESVAV